MDKYFETKTTQINKNKNKKRQSLRNKGRKLIKRPKREFSSDSEVSHLSDFSDGSNMAMRCSLEAEGLSKDHSSFISAKLQE
jgi:hypothetical protein